MATMDHLCLYISTNIPLLVSVYGRYDDWELEKAPKSYGYALPGKPQSGECGSVLAKGLMQEYTLDTRSALPDCQF